MQDKSECIKEELIQLSIIILNELDKLRIKGSLSNDDYMKHVELKKKFLHDLGVNENDFEKQICLHEYGF